MNIIIQNNGALLFNPVNIFLRDNGIDIYPPNGDFMRLVWNDNETAEKEFSRLCSELKAGNTFIEFESDF